MKLPNVKWYKNFIIKFVYLRSNYKIIADCVLVSTLFVAALEIGHRWFINLTKNLNKFKNKKNSNKFKKLDLGKLPHITVKKNVCFLMKRGI